MDATGGSTPPVGLWGEAGRAGSVERLVTVWRVGDSRP